MLPYSSLFSVSVRLDFSIYKIRIRDRSVVLKVCVLDE